jgi:hypothetical protein
MDRGVAHRGLKGLCTSKPTAVPRATEQLFKRNAVLLHLCRMIGRIIVSGHHEKEAY